MTLERERERERELNFYANLLNNYNEICVRLEKPSSFSFLVKAIRIPAKLRKENTIFNLSSNTDARMHDIYAESLLALAPNAIKSRGGNASCSLILSSNLDSSSLSSCMF